MLLKAENIIWNTGRIRVRRINSYAIFKTTCFTWVIKIAGRNCMARKEIIEFERTSCKVSLACVLSKK